MTIPLILFMWSVVGVPLYQIIVLRVWFKTHADEIWISDIVKSIPFGFIVILGVIIVASIDREKIKYK